VVGLSGAGAVKAVLFDLGGTLWAPFGDRTRDEVVREAAARAATLVSSLLPDAELADAENGANGPGTIIAWLDARTAVRDAAAKVSFADPVFREDDLAETVQEVFFPALRRGRGSVGPAQSRGGAARATTGSASSIAAIAEEFGRDLTRRCRLFPEALSVLAGLRRTSPGLVLGIVSNTVIQSRVIDFYLAECDLDKMVDFRVLSSEAGWRKPHPAIYAAALARAGVRAADAVFVGDRLVEDVAGPKRLGMKAILCCFEGEKGRATASMPDGSPCAQEPDGRAFALTDVPALVRAFVGTQHSSSSLAP
jgi:FMN phosphatase YigB (HAD superfamily)